MTLASRAHEGDGFALIELVLALALTAIVVAVALSALQTYTVRRDIEQGIEAGKSVASLVAESFRRAGAVPADPNAAGLQHPSIFSGAVVAAVGIVDGRIDITYGDDAHPAIRGRRLSLTPYETADLAVVWICGNQIPGPGLEPLGFAGGGRRPEQIATTVEPRYLPRSCR